MKLYNAKAPNGLRVSAFLVEKGLDIPTVDLNVLEGEARTPEFLKRNSLGEIPVLELDDGQVITESVAICRYLESLHPEPPLFGKNPIEQAHIEMWSRRMERQIFDTVSQIALHEFPFFADKIEQIPAYADSQRKYFLNRLKWLDQEMSDGREFIAGDTFTVADITGMAAIMVCRFTEEEIPGNVTFVKKWEERMCARPSWPMD